MRGLTVATVAAPPLESAAALPSILLALALLAGAATFADAADSDSAAGAPRRPRPTASAPT